MLITTFRGSEWNKHASRCIESALKRWPEKTRIRIYHQGALRSDYLEHPRVEYYPLSEIPKLEQVRDALGQHRAFRGFPYEGEYSYRHDAHKWCLKAFAMAHASVTIEGRIAWMDSDIYWHSDVPENFLGTLLPDDVHHCYLGRENVPMYTETGFVAINTRHPINNGFWRLYVNTWMPRGKAGLALANLREWHCCYVFDMVRQQLDAPGVSLTEGMPPCMHPFINSILGDYADHTKGQDRKRAGHSWASDLIIDRSDHPYWRAIYEQPEPAR